MSEADDGSVDSQLAAALDEGGWDDDDDVGNEQDPAAEYEEPLEHDDDIDEEPASPGAGDMDDDGDMDMAAMDALADALLRDEDTGSLGLGRVSSDNDPFTAHLMPYGSEGEEGVVAKRRKVVAKRSGSREVPYAGAGDMPDTSTAGGNEVQGQQRTDAPQEECHHPSFWAGMCVVCGAPRPQDDAQGVPHLPPGRPTSKPTAAPSGSQSSSESHGDSDAEADMDAYAEEVMRQASAAHPASRMRQPSAQHARQQQQQQAQVTRVKHLHARGHLEIGRSEAERLRKLDVERLLGARKLVLVLDLDHTLLNSVHVPEVDPQQAAQLHAILQQEAALPNKLLYNLQMCNLWTKLRPYVHEFLDAARQLFELHIYTMGDRNYAAAIREILDPEKKLFAGVISMNDSTSTSQKDLDVALVADNVTLIIDDTEHVWPKHRRNLIQVERYHFFPHSAQQFRTRQKSLLELGRDESNSNGTLATCLRVVSAVHKRFFEDDAPLHMRDVRYHLSAIRGVLSGCAITFTHCWPSTKTNFFSEPIYQLAECLGAECLPDYDPQVTTHVVAGAPGTQKMQAALADGKKVVSPDWLHACFYRWQHVDEAGFPPVKMDPGRRGASRVSELEELQMVLAAAGGGTAGSTQAPAAGGAHAGQAGEAGAAPPQAAPDTQQEEERGTA